MGAAEPFRTSVAISPTPADFAPLLFAGRWREALDTVESLEYDAIEISVRDPDDADVRGCERAARERGIAISAIATGQSFYSDGWAPVDVDPTVQRRLMERMRRIVDLAAPWRALVVIGGVRGVLEGDPSERRAAYRQAVSFIRDLADHAASMGVDLVVEPINRYETNFINTVDQALDFIEATGADNIGVLPDTFHMNIEEVSLERALRIAGGKMLHVQFTDSNRHAAGQGHIDFGPLAAVLREIGYPGYLSAEILPEPDDATAARQALEFFRGL
jgi:sugar phosphate isomerase/epimerase